MNFDQLTLNVAKIIGFVMVAVGVGGAVWTGTIDIQIPHILLFILGIIFSGGSFLLSDMKGPTDSEIKAMHEKELNELYLPADYRAFALKQLAVDALHRRTQLTQGLGDDSGRKGH